MSGGLSTKFSYKGILVMHPNCMRIVSGTNPIIFHNLGRFKRYDQFYCNAVSGTFVSVIELRIK